MEVIKYTSLPSFPSKNLQDSDSFATNKDDWEGARELTKLCPLLGYSCDESPALFMDQSQ